MSDTQATTTLPVPRTCEDKDCSDRPTVATIVTGDIGDPGIAVYCDDCADDRDDSKYHTPVGEVTIG